MMDFKGEKVEDMAVMAEEWLGWPLECLQQLNGGRKVVWWLLKGDDGWWDACNSRPARFCSWELTKQLPRVVTHPGIAPASNSLNFRVPTNPKPVSSQKASRYEDARVVTHPGIAPASNSLNFGVPTNPKPVSSQKASRYEDARSREPLRTRNQREASSITANWLCLEKTVRTHWEKPPFSFKIPKFLELFLKFVRDQDWENHFAKHAAILEEEIASQFPLLLISSSYWKNAIESNGHVAQNVEIAHVVPSSSDTFNSLVEVALAESSPTMTPTNSRDKAPMFQIASPLPPFFQHFLRRVLEPAISPAFPTALQSNTFAFHETLPTPSHI
ncbi:hypothetical protein L3X38_024355 [Prunus dulcis]|uniref:Uncharacterized protein n=1 Tax=Prunus dulcis TaxID=3755 RepID=A0AAD4Z5D2_PRUDU|nr:hypothetical protein L3X38_024355 [Prunus dulcis]